MSNGLFLTPDELVIFLADSHRDENGNIVYGSKAAKVLDAAMERTRTEKREKKKLDGENLDKYISIAKRLIDENQAEIDRGGRLMSRRAFAAGLELGESTVRQNKTLNDIYERFKAANSNVRPSTVNNEPDSFFDEDF